MNNSEQIITEKTDDNITTDHNDQSAQDSIKPPIILIHGFRGSPLGLETIAKRLELNNYKVYIPAIPPFAGAEFLNFYGPDHYAEFIKGYIEKNNIDHPILIGHSMGSIIAAATASRYPELLHDQLILMSPISTRTPLSIKIISPLSALLPRSWVDYVTTKYLFVSNNRLLWKQALKLTNLCSSSTPPPLREAIKAALFSTKYHVGIFKPEKNTLLLAGGQDRLIKKTDTQKLAHKLQAKTIFLPRTGHLHNYEQPLETANAILEFIQSEPNPSSNE